MRYAELRPDQLQAAWDENPLAILPIGALEWHGPHLPLGLDGLVAESFAEMLADRSGGVLLPCIWTPMTTLPHKFSLQISTETFREILDQTLGGLSGAGATKVALVTGHYAQGHHVELYEAAIRAMNRQEGCLVYAATPLEPLGDPVLLDHAARCETSQLLAIRPALVQLGALPEGHSSRESAVLGENPRGSSAEEGRKLFSRAIDAWHEWLRCEDPQQLLQHYSSAKHAYADYIDRFYRGSWEKAILDWWTTK